MLKKLDIRNFTLIDHLEMTLYPGFSVITGETGAGKSIVIGAIGLLLGNRADAKQVKRGCDKCIIEATFDLSIYHSDVLKDFFEDNDLDYEPEECLLRREVNASGKSRAFINDTPVTLALMRELGEQLIDVHSQHQNLLLSKEDFQLNVVDIIARDRQQLADYRSAFAEYRSAQRRLEELREQIATSRDNEDFLRFQQKELADANLQADEQESLEQTAEIMSHAEQLLELELPVLVGISRKSMIYKLIGGDPTTSLNGTTVLNTISLMKGASILRVHDVREAVEVCKIAERF